MQNNMNCRHHDDAKAGETCLKCLNSFLCDPSVLPIQIGRTLEELLSAVRASFPGMRLQSKTRLWKAVVAGILVCAQKHSDHLSKLYEILVGGFLPEELLATVIPALVDNISATVDGAVLVIQLLSFSAQTNENCRRIVSTIPRLVHYLLSCVFSGTAATKEAALFLTWYLLGHVPSQDFENDDFSIVSAVKSSVVDHLDSLTKFLSKDSSPQLQLNLLGLLSRITQHDFAAGGDDLAQAVLGGREPTILQRFLFAMVNVRLSLSAILFCLAFDSSLSKLCMQAPSNVAAAVAMFLNTIGTTQSATTTLLRQNVLDYVHECLRKCDPVHHVFLLELTLTMLHQAKQLHIPIPYILRAFKIVCEYMKGRVNSLPLMTVVQSQCALTASVDMLCNCAFDHTDTFANKETSMHVDFVNLSDVFDIEIETLEYLHHILVESITDESVVAQSYRLVQDLSCCMALAIRQLTFRMTSQQQSQILSEKAGKCFRCTITILEKMFKLQGENVGNVGIILNNVPQVFHTAAIVVEMVSQERLPPSSLDNVKWLVIKFVQGLEHASDSESMTSAALELLIVLLRRNDMHGLNLPISSFIKLLLEGFQKLQVESQRLAAEIFLQLLHSKGYCTAPSAARITCTRSLLLRLRGSTFAALESSMAKIVNTQITASNQAMTWNVASQVAHFLAIVRMQIQQASTFTAEEAKSLLSLTSQALNCLSVGISLNGQETWFAVSNTLSILAAVYRAVPELLSETLCKAFCPVIKRASDLQGAYPDGLAQIQAVALFDVAFASKHFERLLRPLVQQKFEKMEIDQVQMIAGSMLPCNRALEFVFSNIEQALLKSMQTRFGAVSFITALNFGTQICRALISSASMTQKQCDQYFTLYEHCFKRCLASARCDTVIACLQAMKTLLTLTRRADKCMSTVQQAIEVLVGQWPNMQTEHESEELSLKLVEFVHVATQIVCQLSDDGESEHESPCILTRRQFIKMFVDNEGIRTLWFKFLMDNIFGESSRSSLFDPCLLCLQAFSGVVIRIGDDSAQLRKRKKRSHESVFLLGCKLLPFVNARSQMKRLFHRSQSQTNKFVTFRLLHNLLLLRRLEVFPVEQSPVAGKFAPHIKLIILQAQTVLLDESSEHIHEVSNQIVMSLLANLKFARLCHEATCKPVRDNAQGCATTITESGLCLFGNVWSNFVLQKALDAANLCMSWSTALLHLLTIHITTADDPSLQSSSTAITENDQRSLFCSLNFNYGQLTNHRRGGDRESGHSCCRRILAHMVVFLLIFDSPTFTSPEDLQCEVLRWIGQHVGRVLSALRWAASSKKQQKAKRFKWRSLGDSCLMEFFEDLRRNAITASVSQVVGSEWRNPCLMWTRLVADPALRKSLATAPAISKIHQLYSLITAPGPTIQQRFVRHAHPTV